MKETDPCICEWCNREIEETETEEGCTPRLSIEEKPGYTTFKWMHINCRDAAVKAIDDLVIAECFKNDCNENFKP